MRTELLTLGRLGFCVADVLMICIFFHPMFSRRIKGLRFVMLFSATTLVIFLENAFGSTVLNLLSLPSVYILFACFAFRISISNGIVYALIYFIVFSGGREAAFEILFRLLSMITPYAIPPWSTSYGMPYLVIEYILALLIILFIGRFTSKLKISGNDRFCWYLLIMPIASLAILISYLYMDFPESGFIAIMMSFGAFLLYLSNAAIFIILERYTEAMDQINAAQLSALKMDMEKTHYESIEKANQLYKKHLHDMHQYFNQFRNLAVRGEDQVIVKIVEELEGRLKAEEDSILYSRDTVVNVLLAEYCGRAKEKGIEMTVFVEDGLDLGHISDGDKISMFGNLLANSLEAASQCKEQERHIGVKLYMGNAYFVIFQVENTYIAQVQKKGEHFLTTKKDKENHGLGIKIVEELAEKYGGVLELQAEKRCFTATLMVSLYQ